MRLIDADVLKRQLSTAIIMFGADDAFADGICKIIDKQPTAYDVDKVVEQTEKDTELAYNRYMDCSPNAPQSVVAKYSTQYQERSRCLKIVKSGSID